MEFKDIVKKTMLEKGMTQKELSIKSNITESSISKYLNGERTPRVDVIVSLANALNVSVDYLLGNDVPDNICSFLEAKNILARSKNDMTETQKKGTYKISFRRLMYDF